MTPSAGNGPAEVQKSVVVEGRCVVDVAAAVVVVVVGTQAGRSSKLQMMLRLTTHTVQMNQQVLGIQLAAGRRNIAACPSAGFHQPCCALQSAQFAAPRAA